MPDWKPTACILCECNCGIEVRLGGPDGRRFERIRGDKAHPASRGYLCQKAGKLDHYQNGERLTSPLRRRADGSFEPIDWDTAIREVAQRLGTVRDEHGGEAIFYYGGGGQGNHLPGAYAAATRRALGSRYRSNALAQEKTGEFWVADRMLQSHTRGDFEHCEVAIFLGKNPWQSHGIPRARVTLKAIAKDPARTLVVIDPVRTETADMADIWLAPHPGTDAWLLAALLGCLPDEGLLRRDWLAEHTLGLEEVEPVLGRIDVAGCAAVCGVAEDEIRALARRVGAAASVALFEDLGVQMNRHSTLVSYLERLVWLLTGHFGREGTHYVPSHLVPIATASGGRTRKTPVTGAPIISGLVPCNVIPEEILTEHPERFRAMLVEAANPAHSLADSPTFREALSALDTLVVIDIAMTETARLADYVLPTSTQYEKAEATFFNFDFPDNAFHLRHPLLPPPDGVLAESELHARLVEALGAMPTDAVEQLSAAYAKGGRLAFAMAFQQLRRRPDVKAVAPVVVYRALAEHLPDGLENAAVLWGAAHIAAAHDPAAIRRAGHEAPGPLLGERLFDAMLSGDRGFVFTRDTAEQSWERLGWPDEKIRVALPDLLAELDGLAEGPELDPAWPFVLAAGERRSFTANTIVRDPDWRQKDREGALRVSPADAERLGLVDGGRARLTTRRGSAEVTVEVSDRMRSGHLALPNGLGLDGERGSSGVAPNELTSLDERDPYAGTPLHKAVKARLEALA